MEINAHCEVVRCPFLLPIQRHDIKGVSFVTTDVDSPLLHHRVVPVQSDGSVVVRNGKGQEFSMGLVLSLFPLEQFHQTSNCHRHAVPVLSVSNIQAGGATVDFTRQERKMHVVCAHEA